MEVSVEQEIKQIQMGKPHVVIVGAGASYAAFPDGDKSGKKLPLMNNLLKVLELDELVGSSGLTFTTSNFEEIYDQLYRDGNQKELLQKLEDKIYDYFASLEMPEHPTIYDHLVLSLREKDVIVTFNWDPFLVLACRRNAKRFGVPRLLFLHGNVSVGYCDDDKVVGFNGNPCSQCGELLSSTKLLYPISEKNYQSDGFISLQWKELALHLKEAFMISVFGYGAPKSDVSAIDLMKSAWGSPSVRVMEQTEIIDIRSEDDLCEAWDPFIHSHHYEIHSSFYDSWISNHPRRTGEAYINQYWNAQFVQNNPVPNDCDFSELWTWFDRLKQVEDHGKDT